MKDVMSEDDVTFQFEKSHACVIFTNKMSAATGKRMPRLYVQLVDQYRFQREFTLEFRHKPGDSKTLYWESHVYKHPARRVVLQIGRTQAINCIRRILELCRDYPDLLFNVEDERRARSEGMVHFLERLHDGAAPSKRML